MSWMNENRIRSPVQRDTVMRRRKAYNPKKKKAAPLCHYTRTIRIQITFLFLFVIPQLLSYGKTHTFSYSCVKNKYTPW